MKCFSKKIALSLLFVSCAHAADVSFDNNILLEDSSSSSVGNVLKDDIRFLHNYGPENVFLGKHAGNFDLNTSVAGGNAGIGYRALTSVSTGANNTGVGHNSLDSVTTGQRNTAVGAGSTTTISASNDCTAVGFSTLLNNTSSEMTAVGSYALYANSTGVRNTACGAAALYAISTGRDCTAVGHQALVVTTGINNTAVGSGAGVSLTTGSANILIGAGANVNNAARSNCIVIGTGATTSSADNQIRIGFGALASTTCFIQGIRGVTTNVADGVPVLIDSAGQLGTVSSALRYKENITPVSDIRDQFMNVEPVSFNYKGQDESNVQYGFIAEDFAKQFPELVVYNEEGEVETIKYHLLDALLVKMIQEQQKAIEELKKEINELKKS